MTARLRFGSFQLLPEQRLLLDVDRPVRLGSRALDILIALVERAGTLVSKDELTSLVWPDTFVEEANLRVHIGALRRVLGDGRGGARFISNIPGRGYSFVAAVEHVSQTAAVAVADTPPVTYPLPPPAVRVVGRESSVSVLATQLLERRFITIVGPGGIGKTSVALTVADEVSSRYEHGARFVDLARLADGRLIASMLATTLGISIYSEDPLTRVLAYLSDRQMLIVLDNCEHVIEEAARLAEQILRSPHIHVLATSREPLRSAGEWVHRLAALDTPPAGSTPTAPEALAYSAVQLFVERASSSSDLYQFSDADAPIVSDICRRLDGIPLAIELAAATIDTFGLRGLAARLSNRLSLLTRGRRTALPRHQTLRAALDWSYDMLPACEQIVLRRLSVFAGAFTLECATVAGSSDVISAAEVLTALTNLASKSLVTVDVTIEPVMYRLLETTREYALEKLRQSGETVTLFRRHALHQVDLLQQMEQSWSRSTAGVVPVPAEITIDNVRTALDWSFSHEGDRTIGQSVAAAAVPLWMHLSLMQECRSWVQRALAPEPANDVHLRMQLQTALGFALMYTQGATDETRSTLSGALAGAEALGDVDYQLRALWALCVVQLNNGLFREALTFAERLRGVAEQSSDRADLAIGDRMIGFSLHYLGKEAQARRYVERMLGRYPAPTPHRHMIRFQFDLRITAQLVLAEILWIQGQPEAAMHLVRDGIDEAASLGHTITLCNALAKACPVALLVGDLEMSQRYAAMLMQEAQRNVLVSWQAEAACFASVVDIRKGDLARGLASLRKALGELPGMSFSLRYSALLGELAEALGRAGRIDQAMQAIDTALERTDRHDERWCYPELMRIKGELLLHQDRHNPDAQTHFERALEAAHSQGSLSWELRAANSLVAAQAATAAGSPARTRLQSIYSRFTEGFGTADLRRARALLGADAPTISGASNEQ